MRGGASEILDKAQSGELSFLYLLNFDDLPTHFSKNSFIVYQGHHGDSAAQMADVILPGCAYVEKEATYVNTEGRVQKTSQALAPLGEAREDWRIIRALSDALGITINYDNVQAIRADMGKIDAALENEGVLSLTAWVDFKTKNPQRLDSRPFEISERNFYLSDIISRHSPTMAKCVEEITLKKRLA